MASRITLKTVLDHIQASHSSLQSKIQDVYSSLHEEIRDVKEQNYQTRRILEQFKVNVMAQLDTISDRLNDLEVATVEQKHEQRIQRLEKLTSHKH
jgi:hypothetical protein